jgi:hypothetical protein
MTRLQLTKVSDCFYSDDSGNIYFCVSEFLRVNQLPDDPSLRIVVVEELSDMFPEVRVIDGQSRPPD